MTSAVAFSGDGKTLLTGADDGMVCAWDANSGRRQWAIDCPRAPVRALAFAKDGTLLVACVGSDLMAWNVSTRKEEPVLARDLRGAVVSADGGMLAARESLESVTVWDLRTLVSPRSFKVGQGAALHSVLPGGRSIVVVNRDRSVEVISENGSEPLKMPASAVLLGLSSDGTRAAVSTDDKLLKVLQVPSGQEKESYGPGISRFGLAVFSRDGKFLATAESHGGVTIWDRASGKGNPTEKLPFIFGAAFSPDGKLLAVATSPRLTVLDTSTGKPALDLPGPSEVSASLAFGDGGRVIVTTANDRVWVWDAATGREQRSFALPGACTAAASADGSRLLAGDKRSVHCLSLPDGKELWKAAAGVHGDGPSKLRFSPDGLLASCGGNDSMGRVWRVATGELVAELPIERGQIVHRVEFLRDGSAIFLDSQLWDVKSKQIRHKFTGSPVAVSPDEMSVATIQGNAGTFAIVIHDLAGGKERARWNLAEEARVAKVLVFSPDGKKLAEVTPNGSLFVYDVASKKEIRRIERTINARHIVLSPDAKEIVASMSDGTVLFIPNSNPPW